jgi:DNA-binding beta-propeller fold protein YncE
MTMKPHTGTFKKISYTLLACLLLAGCAAPDTTCKYIAKDPIFFPPAPDEPRIQYLTGINSSDDILVGEKKRGGVSLMVTGADQANTVVKLGKAYGIEVHKGKIYVAQGLERRISIIDLAKGTFTEPPGTKIPRGPGSLAYPINLTLDDDDNLYVADTARREIVVYDAQGNFKTSYGKGIGPKSKITDVKYYKGKLFALDMGSNLLRVLDRATGEQQAEFGNSGKPDQRLAIPGNFTIDDDGNIYITNIGSNKVVKLDQDGNYIDSFGGVGDQFGQFSKPKGIAVDKDKRIYVVDGGTSIVQLFNDKFRSLTYFGWPGLEHGSLNNPSGITTSTENIDYFQKFAAPGFKVTFLIYVVSQFGQEFCIPRISVYGFGQMVKK